MAKYGLTPGQLQARIDEQGGRCPFCSPGTEVANWDIDHDHRCCPGAQTCGQCLRAMLCHKHNTGLGYWDDNPDLLRAAADYIERWRAVIQPQPRPAPVKRGPRKQGVFLTSEQMDAVRAEYRPAEGVTQTYLAKRYGVSQATISNIIRFSG